MIWVKKFIIQTAGKVFFEEFLCPIRLIPGLLDRILYNLILPRLLAFPIPQLAVGHVDKKVAELFVCNPDGRRGSKIELVGIFLLESLL